MMMGKKKEGHFRKKKISFDDIAERTEINTEGLKCQEGNVA